jgi:hypothetical protein
VPCASVRDCPERNGHRTSEHDLVDYDELEERAAEMVVAELGAVCAQMRDLPGAPSGTRDYDVVFADGHEEPLEVTSNLDKSVMHALHRTHGGVLKLDANVQGLWMVVGSHTWTDENGPRSPSIAGE